MEALNILVLGIGNPLMRDDGVGVQVARRMVAETRDLPGVQCLDGGTLGYLLAGYLEGVQGLIVVDAARMKAVPGTVAVFENEDMDRFLSTHPNRSVHEVGLADLMVMALLAGDLPRRRALVGVQPEETGWGTDLSGKVADSVALACEKVAELIEAWRP